MGRKAREVRQRPEHRLIVLGVVVGDMVGVLRAITAVLDRALEWPESLRPKAVLAPVPEEEGSIGCARYRHGASGRGANSAAERPVVLELSVGQVTGRTGDLAVGAQTGIEEECLTQPGRAGIIGDAIGGVGRQWRQGLDREGADEGQFRLGPAGREGEPEPRGGTAPGEQGGGNQEGKPAHAMPQNTRLKVTSSAPLGPSIPRSNSHQPGMLNFTPSRR